MQQDDGREGEREAERNQTQAPRRFVLREQSTINMNLTGHRGREGGRERERDRVVTDMLSCLFMHTGGQTKGLAEAQAAEHLEC